jgi:hypothetical protein
MTAAVPNDLARALRAFFADHLPRVRGTSPHTIRSYRDSLVLLLRFVATRLQRSVIQLDLDDLGPQPVLAFLQHLELDRHNSVATRNVRLAAIHAFFRYCAMEHPARLAHCQRVLAVPFKRTGSRPVEYLEHEEIEAILGAVDRGTADGRRDYALLATMFNTGARVGEIVALRQHQRDGVRLDGPVDVRPPDVGLLAVSALGLPVVTHVLELHLGADFAHGSLLPLHRSPCRRTNARPLWLHVAGQQRPGRRGQLRQVHTGWSGRSPPGLVPDGTRSTGRRSR